MKYSDSFPTKEKGVAYLMENVLDPIDTSFEDGLYNVIGEGVYSYETKTVTIDNVASTRYQQYIRSEVIGNANPCNVGKAIDQTNFCWAWGSNAYGQLGNNADLNSRSSPISVVGGKKFAAIDSNGSTNIGLMDDGTIWTWGFNTNGELGINTDINHRSSPVSMVGGLVCVGVSINWDSACYALDRFGYCWSWGYNNNGQLGNNTDLNSRSSPISVVGAIKFVTVKKGLGIDFSNYCWAWGDNVSGQLGDGSATHRSSPVSILGVSNIAIVDKGTAFTAMLDRSGVLYMCGSNASGQLGTGNTTSMSSPVSVTSTVKFVDVACGGTHCVALDRDGIIWAWGSNTAGQLGLGDANNRSTPTSIGTNRFVLLGASSDSSMGIDTNGILWSWGDNTAGKLGDSTTTNKSRPTSIAFSGIWKTRKVY